MSMLTFSKIKAAYSTCKLKAAFMYIADQFGKVVSMKVMKLSARMHFVWPWNLELIILMLSLRYVLYWPIYAVKKKNTLNNKFSSKNNSSIFSLFG